MYLRVVLLIILFPDQSHPVKNRLVTILHFTQYNDIDVLNAEWTIRVKLEQQTEHLPYMCMYSLSHPLFSMS